MTEELLRHRRVQIERLNGNEGFVRHAAAGFGSFLQDVERSTSRAIDRGAMPVWHSAWLSDALPV
jgi:hypothetical protein